MENIEQNIQAYLTGKLVGEDLTSFEQRLKDDPSFAEEVLFQNSVREVFIHEDLIAAHVILKNLAHTAPVEPDFDNLPMPPLRSVSRQWLWGLGTGLVFVCLIGFFGWQSLVQNREKEKTRTVLTQFLTQSKPFSNHLNFADDDESPFAVGVRQYESATKYADAAATLNEHLKDKPTDNMAQLYLGVCYLYTTKTDSAISKLQPLTSVTDDFIAQSARWHLGLALMQRGDAVAARPLLQSVLRTEEFKEDAQRVLKALE